MPEPMVDGSKWCNPQTPQTPVPLFYVKLPHKFPTRDGADVITIESTFDIVRLDDAFHYLVIADYRLAEAMNGINVCDVANASLLIQKKDVARYLGHNYSQLKGRLLEFCADDAITSDKPSTDLERHRICSLIFVAREAFPTAREVLVTRSDKDGIMWHLPGIISKIEISHKVIVTVSYHENRTKRVISCEISRSVEELNQQGVFFRYEAGLPAGKILRPPIEVDIMDFEDEA